MIRKLKQKLILAGILLLCIVILIPIGISASNAKKQRELQEAQQAELEERLASAHIRLKELQDSYYAVQSELTAVQNDPAFRAETVHTAELPLLAIGDSVMLGARAKMLSTFPNGEVDARENRSYYPAYYIIQDHLDRGAEFGPVVIGLGTNSPLDVPVCEEIVRLCGDRQVFWLTTTNNWQFYNTEKIWSLGSEFDNLTIIDWETYSKDHPEYFYEDQIHLTEEGRQGYTDLVFDSITERYYSLLPAKEDHRLCLIGDDDLLSTVSDLSVSAEDTILLSEETTEQIAERMRSLKEAGMLPEKILMVFGRSSLEDPSVLQTILSASEDASYTLVLVNDRSDEIPLPDLPVTEYNPDPEEFLYDGVHLSAEGNTAFAGFLNQQIAAVQEDGGTSLTAD
ncbi:MAG: hypothetical protein IKE28_11705 [Solobacterium sp.]|nr:hypothetical protein [Solobacterium sp.]